VKRAFFDDSMNEVELYVDMLGSGMVLMVFREFNG